MSNETNDDVEQINAYIAAAVAGRGTIRYMGKGQFLFWADDPTARTKTVGTLEARVSIPDKAGRTA